MRSTSMRRPRWVDFHCHLDLYRDHEQLIAECDAEQVATLTVTTTPKAWARNKELAERSSFVRVALGLHPQLVGERESELPLFERLLEQSRYVGEVGLDAGPRFYKSFEAQERVFSRILQACAEQGDKILTVHSVRTVPKVLAHVEKFLPAEKGTVVLHWFTGTASEARRAIELGCYFSINTQMFKSAKQQQLIASLPLDRILTETDGPFVVEDGQPVRPRDVRGTVLELARLRGVEQEEMAAQMVRNLSQLVRG
ncbi:Qat anti-phage system TatD family nuclease QatD [Pseudomonas sp. CR3202]|uniref:Qat anti-phage system TatD family nuclease QatD n=1 Tax=Pseudomonas sp. CR3202 TaxID=3351532 RepID=UPI003BF3A7DE